ATRSVIGGNQESGGPGFGPPADVRIEGNYIGVGADGFTPLGNGVGLALGCDSFIAPAPAPGDGFVVGGIAAGAGNRIAHNNGDALHPRRSGPGAPTPAGARCPGTETSAHP